MAETDIAAESAAAAKPLKPDVFVSYSRRDSEFVGRLREALESRGKDVWLDLDDIRKGEEWWERIERGIESAAAVVAVLSPDFVASEVCADELDHALADNKRLVPVLCRPVEASEVRAELRRINWVEIGVDGDFDNGVDELIDVLETDFDWLHRHARFNERAHEWEDSGRDSSFLLVRNDLAAAERWLDEQAKHDERATTLQTEYILASRRAATRRQRRLLLASGGASIALLVLAAAAVWQWRQAVEREHVALSRQLAASAQAALETDPAESIQLALAGLDQAETEEAWQVLRAAVSASSLVAAVPADRPTRGLLSRDNRFLVVLGEHAALWRRSNWTRVREFDVAAAFCGAFSPDSSLIATTNESGTQIRETETGRERMRLPQASCPIFSPDGKTVASTGDDGLVVWSVRSGQPLATLDRGGQLGSLLDFSADGRFLVYGQDGKARVWRTADWRPVPRPQQAVLREAALASRAPFPVQAARGGTAVVLERRTGVRLARLTDESRWTSASRRSPPGTQIGEVALSADGRFLIDVGNTDVVDLRTGRIVAQPDGAAQFTPHSRLYLEQTGPETIAVVDVATWTPVAELRGGATFGVTEGQGSSLSLSPDGAFAITTGIGDRFVRVWALPVATGTFPISQFDTVWGAAFGRGGVEVLASEGGTSEQLGDVSRLWHADWNARARSLRLRAGAELAADALSPDGALTLALAETSELRDARSGERVAALGEEWTDAAFSPNGKFLVTRDALAGSSSLGVNRERLAVWNARTGKQIASLGEKIAQTAEHLAVTSDGRRVAIASVEGTSVWTTRRQRVLGPVAGGSPQGVWFSPDGKYVTTAFRDNRAVVLPTSGGDRPVSLRTPDAIRDVSFSPDSRFVVVADFGGTARIWTVTGESVATLRGHTTSLLAARFSPDGRYVMTVGADGTVRIHTCDACVSRAELRARARARTNYLADAAGAP